MESIVLRDFHSNLNARFLQFEGVEAVADYGDSRAERTALARTVGALDLSYRGRVCLLGHDRIRFLHGQVTNDVNALQVGQGCYAALVTAKGKMVSDLNVYRLQDELLLDFEPGLTQKLIQRLEQYIVADDVQVVDVAPHYQLLSVQGPRAVDVLRRLAWPSPLPTEPMSFVRFAEGESEIYLMNQARLSGAGFDLFVPNAAAADVAQRLHAAVEAEEGRFCGWTALETRRIELGLPRFGADMDEAILPPEAGLEARAISYRKGCYIGQEIINRIRTYGQVTKQLRGLRLADDLPALPWKGDKLLKAGQEVGFVTSAVASPGLAANIALGYVRREADIPGAELTLRSAGRETLARVVPLPFPEKFT